jgi:hypothetical protein
MDDEMTDAMNDALAYSLEGNSLKLQAVVNAMLDAKAIEQISSMKVDVAQSVYGAHNANEDADQADPEEEDWSVPEDDEDFTDDDIEDLFAELEDLTDDQADDSELENEDE